MNYIFAIIVPLIFLLSFAYASVKKVKLFDTFTDGAKGAIPLVVSLFPYIAAVTMLVKLLEVSGLQTQILNFVSPVFSFFCVPEEIAPLVLVKPLSGSGGIAVLSDLLHKYGTDSYVSRCACVMYGSSETIFYIGAVYFAGLKRKKLTLALAISLFSFLMSVVFSCFLCSFM
jgi:spore maturation protein B